jgi:CheY-like chemotaxis protein
VLFADDYADTRELIEMALTWQGYRVLLAENGREAVTIAEQQHPDVIVMDIFMPEMDGIAATRLLKAGTCATIPVIAFTAKPAAIDGARHLFAAVCAKAGEPKELEAAIRAVLDRPHAHGAN